jgi:hypothetical protein
MHVPADASLPFNVVPILKPFHLLAEHIHLLTGTHALN